MRKLFIVLVLISGYSHSIAQTVEVQEVCGSKELNPEGKEFGSNPVRLVTVRDLEKYHAGQDADHFYTIIVETVGPTTKMYLLCNRLDNGKQVYAKEIKVLDYEKKLRYLLNATFDEGRLKIMWEQAKGSNNNFFIAEIDPEKPEEGKITFTTSKPNPRSGYKYKYDWTISQDKSHYLVYSYTNSYNKRILPCFFFVFDKHLKLVKEATYQLPELSEYTWLNSAAVSNKGDACMLIRVEPNGDDGWPYTYTYIYYDLASGKFIQKNLDNGHKEILHTSCDFNKENNLVFAGSYSDLTRKEIKRKSGWALDITGLFFTEMKPGAEEIKLNTSSPVKNDFKEIMNTVELNDLQDPNLHLYFDDQGATYFVLEQMMLNGADRNVEGVIVGQPRNLTLLISKINSTGQFVWTNIIPRSIELFAYSTHPRGYMLLIMEKDIVVLYADHKENFASNDPYNIKILNGYTNGAGVMMTLKDDGSTKKEKFYDNYVSLSSDKIIAGGDKSFLVYNYDINCHFLRLNLKK